MERNEELWGRMQEHARRFLRRFEDAFTRQQCDDLVQESAVAAWQWAGAARRPERFAAAVRTIARRKRYRALRDHHRRREELSSACLPAPNPKIDELRVAGRSVPREWLVARLVQALNGLRAVDRRLLLAQQEGFCCAEIAARLDMTEDVVKVRMHRARRRLQKEIERAVKVTDAFEGS